jgi:Tfp pilus assembly protein PilX
MIDIRSAPSRPMLHKQQGAVLFISLIMLLLLTLIGVTAMQVTLLQERMAGGFRIQHQAFEWTEGLLKSTRSDLNDAANSSGPLYYSADAALSGTNAMPWETWLISEPTAPQTQVNAHVAIGTPPAVIGARTLKYFVVSALAQDGVIQNDPNGGDAKAAVQAVFIY